MNQQQDKAREKGKDFVVVVLHDLWEFSNQGPNPGPSQ